MDTWNVLSVYKAGMLKRFKTELQKYRIDIAAVPRGKVDGEWSAGYREFHTDIWW